MNSYTTFIAPPVFGGNQLKLNIPALPVCSGELHAAVAASLTRIIPGAPAANRLALYRMLARENAGAVAATRQDNLNSTWVVAASAGLPQAIGTAAVQQILADAFNPGRVNYDDPRYEYDGVAGTFR